MKKFKRIAAGVMSLVMTSVLTVSANAATRSSGDTSWAVDYIYGAPSSVSSQISVINVGPFPNGFNIDCVTLSGANPVVTATSDAFADTLTIDRIGSYQFGAIPGTDKTVFEITFKAGAPSCKAKGYVYSR